MTVSVSPRLPDLDSDGGPECLDPRFAIGFGSLSLDSAGYSDFERLDDARPFAGVPNASASRRRRRQRRIDGVFDQHEPFTYKTVADGDSFRLLVLYPGTGTDAIHCGLIWESYQRPSRQYRCISYAWESVRRDAAVLCDGYRLPVTNNLLRALRSLRKPRATLLIWADQICINQEDEQERAHQVTIMKHIFHQAFEIYVWLGEANDRSEQLFEYAKRTRRSDDFSKPMMRRVMSQRELKDSIQKLLQRPWFQRVWVIPEVALSCLTTVVCGRSRITWDSLVRLIRDVSLPSPDPNRFDKQVSLPGNPRQRTAIITQMISSRKDLLAHTDITQLLILAKSSDATNPRDKAYAFYSLTHLTTYPDYSLSPSALYLDIAEMYVNAIQWDAAYSSWHALGDPMRGFQLCSILFAAGVLHQRLAGLPSWVPDLTHPWRLAPVWCATGPNFVMNCARDEWSAGIRTGFRAGGEGEVPVFEVVRPMGKKGGRGRGLPGLSLRALVVDELGPVGELALPLPPSHPPPLASTLEAGGVESCEGSTALSYGRHFFTTRVGVHVGIATPGVREGDVLAIVVGADVPVVLRPGAPEKGLFGRGGHGRRRVFQLLCEAFVQTVCIMKGEYMTENLDDVEEIILV